MSVRLALIAVLSLTLSGCQISLPYAKETVKTTKKPDSGNAVAVSNHVSDSPQKSFNNKDSSGEVPFVNAVANETKPNASDAQTESTTASGKSASSSTAKEEKKWDPKAPRLHGIAIGDTKASIDKLGKATDTYTLEDEDETLTINEYDTFSVGFGKNKKVKFVEVFDRKAVTDLNGLRVGDNESAAVKALGKPDTHTTSVLAYKAKGSMLKLDLDPDHNDIISIKLFLNTEKA
ncbi:hypothetical protein [Paenibacillus baekrokdamisoli]|nr:hypothetical protein [Paenibacillus baekrokdamisoli]